MQIFDFVNKRYVEEVGLHEGTRIVETRHKSFFDGREFRSFLDLNIGNGVTQVIKFVSPVDFLLYKQSFFINSGELKFEAALGGTEGGSFNTTLPNFGVNRTNFRPTPFYNSQAVLTTGGTHTGGSVSELVRLKASTNSNFANTVGGEGEESRFLPAGTYYLRFTAVSAVVGVYALRWEEHP